MTIQHRMIQLITLPAESVVMSAADYEHLVASETTIKHLAYQLGEVEQRLASAAEENERLRGFVERFKELLDLDPENHPGTDLGRLMLEVSEALRPTPQSDQREPPHCPTCECGGEAQIRQLCPECLGYMPCAQHPKGNPHGQS